IIDSVRGRELVRGGAAAVVELAVDQPVEYDAWDVEAWTRAAGVDVGGLVSIDVLDEGPLLGRVRVRRAVGDSTVDVVYRLAAESLRLDIEIDIDWHHDEHLLSIAFPLDVRADTAACDVQFGTVQRPTHRSTSWDAAKFEVCAHRFVAVSEPSFGVAVLNNGRYGHGLFDGAVRVSLARAPKYPDPTADRGHHRVMLALLPFGGDLADVLVQAELLNRPLRLVPAGGAGSDATGRSFVEVLGAGVDVDAVKLADDGSGDVVVRLHEACGDRVPVTVRAASRIAGATRCRLDEMSTTALETSDGIVAFALAPFELVTLRLALAAG
nr:glycosyl hydrolase-related protein [Actinomycetota bacterium]